MLKRLLIERFKSIDRAELQFPALTVLFGPNAAGKSNILDAIQALSGLGTARTLSDALTEPIRGYPIETFAFPPAGLGALLSQPEAAFRLEADLSVGKEALRYRVGVSIQPASGTLSVSEEYLTALSSRAEPKGTAPVERMGDKIRIRRKSKPSHPREEPVGMNHTIISDPRLGGAEYRQLERCRGELTGWRVYYLDPRVAMRAAKPPAEVTDIGVTGENIAPFLYRLRAEKPKHFQAVQRTMSTLIPSVQHVDVDLDKRRGTLDVLVRQDGRDFSSRIISEGTLRVLALCAIAVNPWGGTLIAFEEPENGVHPRRLELIAQLLFSLATDQHRQVVVTTHSPLFCDAVRGAAQQASEQAGLFSVRRAEEGTRVERLDLSSPLFRDAALEAAVAAPAEDGVFESLMMRGYLDE